MDSVLVLIAAPGSGAIDAAVLASLEALGAEAPHWLKPGEAAEVPVFPRISEFIAVLKGRPIDFAVVSSQNRRKRFLIADMDSTMIRQECIDELGAVAGLGDRIKEITARAMRGELNFDEALRERVGLLKGLDAGIIEKIVRERITYMPGGRTLIATMRARGAYTALVSGGFRQFTSRVAAHLGFDENQANELIIADGRLTGTVGDPILGEQAKVDALRRIVAARSLDTDDAIAVGDGANDVAMLAEAGMGVALHAKPHVQDSSLIRINHGDLTALLYLQGYRVQDFVEPQGG
jgi:phosphoserine phosphatase